MNRPVRKTLSTPANITGSSRANTNVIGNPKLSGHHSMLRNITSEQQGTTNKCMR